MPGQLKDTSTGICSTQIVASDNKETENNTSENSNESPVSRIELRTDSIAEECEENENTR